MVLLQGKKGGDMVGCDNQDCNIAWYRTDCLRMVEASKGKWYCPTCHASRTKKGQKHDKLITIYMYMFTD